MQMELVRRQNQNYAEISEPEERVHAHEREMLRYNQISCLLPVKLRYVDSSLLLEYDISGRQPLTNLFERKTISKRQICQLIYALDNAKRELEDYLLFPEGLILQPEFLYLEPTEFSVRFCYHPGERRTLSENLMELLKFILDHVDYGDQESVGLAYGLFHVSAPEGDEIGTLAEYVERQKAETACERQEEKNIPHMQEEPPEQEVVSSKGLRGLLFRLEDRFFGRRKLRKQLMLQLPEALEQGEDLIGENRHFITQTLEQKDVERHYVLQEVSAGGEADGTGRIELERFPFIVGKLAEQVDCCLDSPMVSRLHARFLLEQENLYVEDMNSRNGTFVNQNAVTGNGHYLLKEGDVVSFANLHYRLEVYAGR